MIGDSLEFFAFEDEGLVKGVNFGFGFVVISNKDVIPNILFCSVVGDCVELEGMKAS